MNKRYWKFMYQKKHKICYLDLYREKYVLINRILKCFTAITSSASIAAWTIWKDAAFVWGFIIALSQVINAVYETLPFKDRITDMSDLSAKWSGIYSLIEHEWYPIQTGKYKDDEINDLITKYMQSWDEIDNYYFKDDVLPKDEKILEKSQKTVKDYFKNNFGVE